MSDTRTTGASADQPVPARAARADAKRAVLARIGGLQADQARLFAAGMRARAEMVALWSRDGDGPEQFPIIELAGTARFGQMKAAT